MYVKKIKGSACLPEISRKNSVNSFRIGLLSYIRGFLKSKQPMNRILEFCERQRKRAEEVLRESRVREVWEDAGAEVRLVGSLRMGLLCRHRDIDLHVYSAGITTAASFGAMARLAEDPRVVELKCINGLHTEERCVAWHATFRASGGDVWQIDMIHIEAGTRYDGFFERMADRVAALLTPPQRETILRLKYETPEGEDIHGVEYYEAVMAHGVSTLEELRRWVARHRRQPHGYWMP